MSKVSELNKLAKKITGEDPKENTIREILDSISSFFKGSKVKSSNTEKAIKNVTENYTSGGSEGGGTTTKLVVPSESEYVNTDLGPIVFYGEGYKASIGDDVLDFFEALDFSNVVCFIDMFSSTLITHGPELDTSSGQSFNQMFMNCGELVSIPQYDFSNGTGSMGMIDAFKNCSKLEDVPVLITHECDVMYMETMFYGCESLSDDSLNNIMAMCINCPSAEYKELAYLGLTEEQTEKCKTLSNYDALVEAGWTTGFSEVI